MAHGTLRQYEVGDVLESHDRPTVEMFIVLSGQLVQYVDRGANGVHVVRQVPTMVQQHLP